ncbi:hypothetical protein GOP47_0002669 [Adiantum capillus-veneris]|uniref:Beta-glucosidase n=1 Tax=Adiantum capillus-veneris TaxID=13818 RepID=A0A9D4VC16_ADICA|nr:hypothetical protein GOP47_0002669 [Adiantum capillus-veneris]
MEAPCMVLLTLLLLLPAQTNIAVAASKSPAQLFSNDSLFVDRNNFPASFKFGSLTWAIKHEAACYDDGKSDGVWDVFARQQGTVFDGTTPAAGGDHYNRFPEDIQLLVDLGMDSYRFSIAWPRMFPNGTGEVNLLAVEHYNDLIDKLLDAGIEPFVTLYEQDMPQILEDTYGGLLNARFIDDFVLFANACFNAFGDRVKHWITFDEGNDFVPFSYAGTYGPPGRCTVGQPPYNCSAGNSATEPYIAGHNVLLAHAATVDLYRRTYQPSQQGEIGMAIWFRWYEPLTNSTEDKEAAARALDFSVGWFIEPVLYGDYPISMKKIVGSRLPSFTEEESERIRGSVDFIGLNAVTSIYVTNNDERNVSFPGYFEEWGVKRTAYRDGVVIGRYDDEYYVPWGLEKVVNYMRTYYDNIPTYVTALGWGLRSTTTVNDDVRVEFYAQYLKYLIKGISAGADVRGMFAWSLMDGFETIYGLETRFGLYYTDDAFNRYPKLSALWFKNMLTSNTTLVYKS